MKTQYGLLIFTGTLLCLSPVAQGGIKQWDGSANGNWSGTANWTNNAAPVDGDDLIFPSGAANLISTNNIADLRLNSITFTASGYTLHGNAITLTNGIAFSAFSGLATVALVITNGAAQTYDCFNSLATLTLSNSVFLGTSQTLTLAGSGDVVMRGAITGASGLTKSGAGTLTLSGANNYTGTTSIDAGEVSVASDSGLGSTSGNTVVAAGATLTVFNDITTVESVTLNGTLRNLSGSNTFTGPITLGPTNSTVFRVETNSFLNLSDQLLGTSGLVKIGPGTLTLSGSANNTYSGATTVNEGKLVLSKTPGANAIPGSVTIGDAIGGANADILQLAASNQIPNSATVTINSSGLFDLSGKSETIGPLVMDGGTVNGTLTLNGDLTRVASATTGTSQIAGQLSLGGTNRTFTINPSAVPTSMEIGAEIVDGGASAGFTKTGDGDLFLIDSNSFSGLVTVAAGTLTFNNGSSLGAPGGGTVISNGATLRVDGSGAAVNAGESAITNFGIIVNLQGTNVLSGNITLGSSNSVFNVINGKLTLSGALIGSGGLTMPLAISGELVLSGTNANTYAGITTVNGGTLRLNKSNGSNAIPGALVIGDGLGGLNADVVQLLNSQQIADSAAVTINSSGKLDLNNNGETIGPLTMDGGIITMGAGQLIMNGDFTRAASAVSDNSIINGNLLLGGTTRTFTINPNSSSYVLIGAVIGSGGGTAGIIKAGSGTLFLTAANVYEGPTTVAEGTLSILDSGGLGATGGGTVVSNGATLDLAGNLLTVNESSVTLFGKISSVGGETNTMTGTITLGSSNTTILTDGQLTLSGSLQGGGGLFLDREGVLQLSGAVDNLFAGTTIVNQGTLILNKSSGATAIPGALLLSSPTALRLLADNQISDGASVTLNGNATFDMNGHVEVIGALAGTGGSVILGNSLNIGGNNTTSAYGGVISGTGALTKGGTGTMTLSGNNTYSGTTFVTAGTLLINGTQPNSPLSVQGGTLGGTGTAGTINAFAGGRISPGNSPGILTSSNISLAGDSSFVVELNGTSPGAGYDQLNVHGTITLGGTLTGSVGFNPAISNSFVIINNDGNDTVSSTFNNLAEGAIFGLGGYPFLISYHGGDGNDVVLTRVSAPPSTITSATQVGANMTIGGLGISGISYVLEASTNLINWQPIRTNTANSSGAFGFVDTSVITLFPMRFYRVLSP